MQSNGFLNSYILAPMRRNTWDYSGSQLWLHYSYCTERSMSTNRRNHDNALYRLNHTKASKLSFGAVFSFCSPRKVTCISFMIQ